MNMLAPKNLFQDHDFRGTISAVQPGVVVIVSDNRCTIDKLGPVCEFLELRMEVVTTGVDLIEALQEHSAMAVICDVDGKDQDGFHIMKLVARHNRALPIMLLTDGDPVLMGAADAVQDLWGLTSITRTSGFPAAGQLVAFLFGAGRRTGRTGLLPVS